MVRVVSAIVVAPWKVRVRFNDGVEALLDLHGKLQGPVFEPLADPAFFAGVKVAEFGVLTWPNGADLAPEFVLWETRRGDLALQDAFRAWGYVSEERSTMAAL
jgi:hypothetical protein